MKRTPLQSEALAAGDPDTHSTAKGYISRGWKVIPWPRGKKGGPQTGWQTLDIGPTNLSQHFPQGVVKNIGVRLGEPSGGLTDIDLDCHEAVALAPAFLPSTEAVFGRAGKPRSHWLYECPNSVSLRFAFGGTMIVEVRSTGAQTIFPGSTHEGTGELIRWEESGAPARVTVPALERAVRRLAAASLVARAFPEKGTRDETALVLHGVLARAGFDEAEAESFVALVAEIGGASDVGTKAKKARRTKARLEAGKPVGSLSGLARLVGPDVARTFAEWLQIVDHTPLVELLAQAKQLNKHSDTETIARLLSDLASGQHAPLEVDEVIRLVQESTGRALSSLRKQHREVRRGPNVVDEAMYLARKVLERHFANGDHLIRIQDGFWHYTGTYWERIPEGFVQRLLIPLAEERRSRSVSSIVRSAIENLKGLQFRHGDPLRLRQEPPPVINCLNGELWLGADGTVVLRGHRFDSYLTSVLRVSYEPTATAPLFDSALRGIFANASDPEGLISFVWEFFGYAIQSQRPIPAWFLLYGDGRNGKTRLVETLQKLMSERAVAALRIADLDKNPFAIGELLGKLLLIDDDVNEGTLLPDGPLKKIGERKLMTGQLKFRDNFEFIATCLPVLIANSYPRAHDLSLGLRRRAQVLPFTRSFTNEDDDPTLFPRIWNTELPGILNGALAGLIRLFERRHFPDQVDVKRARQQWLAAAHPLTAFITDECRSGPKFRCSITDFYAEYRDWAERTGVRSIESRHQMKSRLSMLGFHMAEVNGITHVLGLAPPESAF